MWMVRAGKGGEDADDFIEKKVVAFSDAGLGPVPADATKANLLKHRADGLPGEKEGTRAAWASQLLRFIVEVKVGDEVAFFDRERRRYVLGKIASEYVWLPDTIEGKGHARRVDWTDEVRRDLLSPATRNTLGSTLTIFKLTAEAEKEIRSHRVPLGMALSAPLKPAHKGTGDETLTFITAETFDKANEFIEDLIDSLTWQEMQELVAGLLRALGYRTTVSEPGPDRGVDVFASPDGLGLQDPRIFVEVKHRTKETASKDIRSFLGGRSKGDKCLYVSTAGFTKDAHYEADRSDVAVTLIALPKLRQLVVDFYDKLDAETRALVPLKRLYWPAKRDE